MSTTTENLTIVQKLEQYGHEALTAVDHAAMRLVAFCATTEANLLTIEETYPFVKQALDWGNAAAAAYGLPMVPIENALASVLAAARAFADPPAMPPVPVPAAA
jgi:hypothetical protein